MIIQEDNIVLKIKEFALKNENIRSIIFNGSRINQNAPVDDFQDYDVMLGVIDPSAYLNDQSFIGFFGDPIIIQHNINDNGSHIYLMLFKGNYRIDMTFISYKDITPKMLLEDSLTFIYLDKDNKLKMLPLPTDESYFVQKPTEAEYNEWTNEFWWCLTNIAKGIYRDELPYVKGMYETVVRKALNKMVNWYIGVLYDFKINPGKFGKWFKRYLPKEDYDALVKTYSGNDYEEIWSSLFEAGMLFAKMGKVVSKRFGFNYPQSDDDGVIEYLKFVKNIK